MANVIKKSSKYKLKSSNYMKIVFIYLCKKTKSKRIVFIMLCKGVHVPNIVGHYTEWVQTLPFAQLPGSIHQKVRRNPCFHTPRFRSLPFCFIANSQQGSKIASLRDLHKCMRIHMVHFLGVGSNGKIVNADIFLASPLQ